MSDEKFEFSFQSNEFNDEWISFLLAQFPRRWLAVIRFSVVEAMIC